MFSAPKPTETNDEKGEKGGGGGDDLSTFFVDRAFIRAASLSELTIEKQKLE